MVVGLNLIHFPSMKIRKKKRKVFFWGRRRRRRSSLSCFFFSSSFTRDALDSDFGPRRGSAILEEKKISSSVSRRQNFDQDNARMKARNKEKHLFVLVFSDGAEWRSEKSRVWPGHDVRAAFDVGGQDNKHPSPPTKLLLVSPSLFDRRLSLSTSPVFFLLF